MWNGRTTALPFDFMEADLDLIMESLVMVIGLLDDLAVEPRHSSRGARAHNARSLHYSYLPDLIFLVCKL